MPAPEVTENYIRIRIKNPDLFIDGSFRTIDISIEEGIKAVIGKLKENPEGNTEVQSYLFDKEKWSVEEASKWVEEHKKYNLVSLITLYKPIDLTDKKVKKVVKYYKAEVKTIDENEKSIWAVVTTNEADRDNEVNTIDSWKGRIKDFMKHPVLLSSHNYMSLQSQIGEIQEYRFTQNGLEMKIKYYAGNGNAESDWAWVLASKGKAMFSVGYIPHKVLEGDAIPEEYKDKNISRVYVDNELLEVSQVVVGSNRGALQMGISNPTMEQCQFAYDIVKSFGNSIPDFSITKIENKADGYSVIPFKSYDLMEETAEWNGAEEVAKADVEDLKIMSTLYMGNGEVKSDYKLPHHIADGYKTNWNGVRGAMAVLFGARGGIKPALSESEKQGAYNHLKKHYEEFGKEAPELKNYTLEEIKTIFSDKKEKISKDSIIISPVEIENMKELQNIVDIYKSGRIISRKNQEILEGAREHLAEAIRVIDELLDMSYKPEEEIEEEVEEEKINANDLLKFIAESKKLLERK